jgi:VanZ family protein
MNERQRRIVSWLPAAAYMLLIWALSSIAGQFNFAHVPFQDKGVHFLEYGTLAVLLAHAIRGTWRDLRPLPTFALAVALATLWGITDEIHQAYVPGRNADVEDVVADASGAALAASLYLVAVRIQLRMRAD